MHNNKEYYWRLARTRFAAGDIGRAFTAFSQALWASATTSKSKLPKPVKVTPVVSTSIPEVVKTTQSVITSLDEKRASIYNWATPPALNAVPFGYLGSEVVTIDFTAGDILFQNDIMRKNLDTLLAGLTRVQGNYFIGVNDPLNSLRKWEKHFGYIARTPEDTAAAITATYFMMEDRLNAPQSEALNVFLVINNINTLTGRAAEQVKTILMKGKSVGVNVIASVDGKHFDMVWSSYGEEFEYLINFTFSNTLVTSKSFNGELIPYSIPSDEIQSLERLESGYYNPDYVNVNLMRVYNDIQNLSDEKGLRMHNDVFQLFMTGGNPVYAANQLSYEHTEEFMKIIMNPEYAQLAEDYATNIDSLTELLLRMDTRLAAGNSQKVDIPHLQEDPYTPVSPEAVTVKAYSNDELDKLVLEGISSGTFQQMAKLSTDDMRKVVEIFGVPAPGVTELTGETEAESEAPVVVAEGEDVAPAEVSTEVPEIVAVSEADIEMYMTSFRVTREKAISALQNPAPVKRTLD